MELLTIRVAMIPKTAGNYLHLLLNKIHDRYYNSTQQEACTVVTYLIHNNSCLLKTNISNNVTMAICHCELIGMNKEYRLLAHAASYAHWNISSKLN